MAGRPKKDSSNLSVDRIISAAWKLVDREGLKALSTRSLAAELNVHNSALYWHIKDKQALQGLMLESVLGDALTRFEAGMHWSDWLRAVVTEQRRQLLSHRDSGLLMSDTPTTERMQAVLFPQLIRPLVRAGFPRSEAIAAGGAVASFLLGWIQYEQSVETRQEMVKYNDPDVAFAYGLDAMIRGFGDRLEKARQQAGSETLT